MPKDAVQISDDEDTASSAGLRPGKRKLAAAEVDKVEWTDDDEDDAYANFRDRASKRRPTGGREKKERERRKREKKNGRAASSGDQDADVPEYLRQRRREFDEQRETLREAGLRLPPDYGDIDFSDDEQLRTLEERPRFDESSGIRPSRAHEDVELEFSAGVIPAPIAQYLRDYQIAGARFLHRLFVYQKGGILGDDMGLGKTVQVAAFLAAAFGKTGDERDAKRMRKMRRRAGDDAWYPRVLVVCPGSLIQNWKSELERWGWWHADTYHGPNKDDVLQTARAGRLEVMITTYVTYKNHRRSVNAVAWDAVIADECHVLKERGSETTRAMNEVNALCRIGLTGTAIQNRYEELWTLLNWTNPGRFGSIAEWRQAISRPLTVGQSHDATLHELSVARKTAKKLVRNLLPEFFLRRVKSLIAHQLPRKTDKVVFCPLTDAQRDAYETFVGGERVSHISAAGDLCGCGSGKKMGWCCGRTLPGTDVWWQSAVFPTVATLQKLANHLTLLVPTSGDAGDKQQAELETLRACVPSGWQALYRERDSIVNLSNPEFCGKWKVLKKLLRFWHEAGDKVLVFSHSVRLLRILQCLFHNTSYAVSYLDGSLSYEDRQVAVDTFNADPGQFVFLISTKAGGVGLNIASANKVVIFDPHWNPAYDLQAQDRAYRIGQVRDVDVFRLVSAGTIEEIVYARQIYKQQQANIGYNASTERRYFKGVQQDKLRKGEIFGLSNLLRFRGDQVVLRDIVNKTNIAEAKVGVNLTDIGTAAVEGGDLVDSKEDGGDDDGSGMSQLAEILTAEDQEGVVRAKKKATRPKTDAIAAILVSAGVEYTHENSEVIGSSKVEAQLSRRAEMTAAGSFQEDDNTDDEGDGDSDGSDENNHKKKSRKHNDSVLFADSQANWVDGLGDPRAVRFEYNPPAQVMKRQFCSMAREFGFPSATDFALVVENWTPEQRTNCLDTFYKRREARLLEAELEVLRRDMMGEGEKLPDADTSESPEPRGTEEGISEEAKEEAGEVEEIKEIKEEKDAATRSTPSTSREIKAWTEEKAAIVVSSDNDDDEL